MTQPNADQRQAAEEATRFIECCGHLVMKCSGCRKKILLVAQLLADREAKAREEGYKDGYKNGHEDGANMELMTH